MKTKDINKQKLVSHIKRLQGQLNSVCSELEKDKTDCTKTSDTLFAATRSFSSLRQDFVQCFLSQEFLDEKKVKKDSRKLLSLLNIIKS